MLRRKNRIRRRSRGEPGGAKEGTERTPSMTFNGASQCARIVHRYPPPEPRFAGRLEAEAFDPEGSSPDRPRISLCRLSVNNPAGVICPTDDQASRTTQPVVVRTLKLPTQRIALTAARTVNGEWQNSREYRLTPPSIFVYNMDRLSRHLEARGNLCIKSFWDYW
jgi:hypothetical protein